MIDPKLTHINKQNGRKEFAMFSEFVKEKSEYMTASACSEQTGSFTAPEKNAAEATCEARENFENCENGARKTAGTFNAINMWSALVSVALFLFAYGFFSICGCRKRACPLHYCTNYWAKIKYSGQKTIKSDLKTRNLPT